MLIGIIAVALIVSMTVVMALPLASVLVALRAKTTGRYLNRYYIVSRKRSGEFELHCHPAFGFYYARPEKFFAMREDAIRRFRQRQPDAELFAITSTLQGFYARSGYSEVPVKQRWGKRWFVRLSNYLLILCNLANYRKRNENEWQFARLIRRVNRTVPLRFTL
ncbi:hypothetical protein Theco_3990 (plasmid) [Thermobacillus composti KWC4]|jgi:hypothetical protein|uniref:Uncharacterized protein n=1 Tax=Thermobacillus composti (strain DSM 18247 / JCM 13945 / KWC4) TaxID=717605 RepID=L0EJX9_THECK|nr:hypothetical protein [Thermobacillus composti]AGA59994.1 hypothetical protein Theco_3990 [Thermobacillus composti KWC4]